jgi:hypothetical protein
MSSASKFRHQDVSQVPPGFHVRTIRAGKHELRIAFPKGARKKGSGQIISILHPKREKNPQTCGGHLNLVRAKIAAMQIPLEVVGNGFGRGFENALIETDSKNPMEVSEYWEKFKAKLSELIDSAKDHDGTVRENHHKRNYTEQVKTSDGRTVFIDVLESGGRWMAEGYPVIKGKVRHVGKPHVAYGASESAAYDALVEKLDKNPGKKPEKTYAAKWHYAHSKTQGGELQVEAKSGKEAKQKLEGMLRVNEHGEGVLEKVRLQRNPAHAKKNLDEIDAAAALAGEFKGSPAESVREVSVDLGKHRDDFAHLAWLYELVFHPAYDRVKLEPKAVAKVFHEIYENDDSVKTSIAAWKKTAKEFGTVFLVFDFSGDEIELVSAAKGQQLEFLGGNQASFAQHLGVFRVKPRHDRDDLGDLVGITYLAKKEQFGDTNTRPYYHVFGEDGGSFPRAFFDELNKRIVLTGGSYRLDEAKLGIIN